MIQIRKGFAPEDTGRACALFWEAFRGKLQRTLGPDDKALSFLRDVIHPDFCYAAYQGDTLVGLAGFKTIQGGLIGGGWRELAAIYGWPGALWRGLILDAFERKITAQQLLMDGIFVADGMRGQGVGSALLDAIAAHAKMLNCHEIRLDVIDTNPRAKALYTRHGFVSTGVVRTGLAAPLLGFRTATTMVLTP